MCLLSFSFRNDNLLAVFIQDGAHSLDPLFRSGHEAVCWCDGHCFSQPQGKLFSQSPSALILSLAQEYNGYKVYWSNGAQIIPPHDKGIAASIEKNLKPWAQYEYQPDHPLIKDPFATITEKYLTEASARYCWNRSAAASPFLPRERDEGECIFEEITLASTKDNQRQYKRTGNALIYLGRTLSLTGSLVSSLRPNRST